MHVRGRARSAITMHAEAQYPSITSFFRARLLFFSERSREEGHGLTEKEVTKVARSLERATNK